MSAGVAFVLGVALGALLVAGGILWALNRVEPDRDDEPERNELDWREP